MLNRNRPKSGRNFSPRVLKALTLLEQSQAPLSITSLKTQLNLTGNQYTVLIRRLRALENLGVITCLGVCPIDGTALFIYTKASCRSKKVEMLANGLSHLVQTVIKAKTNFTMNDNADNLSKNIAQSIAI